MSTGAECYFTEVEPGKWTYWLQEWPYGEWPEGTTFGPFDGFIKAHEHLSSNHANPGGYSVDTHADHVHDWGTKAKRKADDTGWDWDVPACEACGAEPPEEGDSRP